jgi:hypothetical protein
VRNLFQRNLFQRNLFQSLTSLALLVAVAPASGQVSMSIQRSRPEPPVIGLPFTADQTVRIVRHLANGMPVTREIKGHLARTADGVERFDGIIPPTDPDHPDPTTMVYLIDHGKHTATLLNSRLMTATVTQLPADATISINFLPLQASGADRAIKPQDPVTTDLGHRTLNQLELVGRRLTATIPAGKVGNDQPLPVTTDVWVSQQLHLLVNEIEKNPLTGERTFELTNIRSEEPDPALFQVPAGYTVKDAPPMPSGTLSLGTPPAGIPRIAAPPLPDPMASEIEQARNSPSAALKDELAYKLANLNADIPQAQSLSEDAIAIEEKQLADFSHLPASPLAFAQMLVLSRYWNTLGLIYFREKKYQLAESYTRAAWELDPKAFVGVHLGRILQFQHRPAEAKTAYLMALSLPASDQERQQIQTRLAELGVTSAQPDQSVQPQPVSIVTPLPSLSAAIAPSGNGPLLDILLSHDAPAAVSFLRGDPALKEPVTRAVQSALAGALPDAGPEKVVRRAWVTCDARATPACVLHFFTSREAQSPESSREALTPLL